MVEWFREVILERILKPIADALFAFITGLAEVVFMAIFGTSFLELVETFTANVFAGFATVISNFILTWLNGMFYANFVIILFVTDIIASGFNMVAGIRPIQIRTANGGWTEQYLIELLFTGSGISNVYFGIMLLGLILCVMFALFAIAKSMFDYDNERPVGKVLAQTWRALMIYLLLPFFVLAGVQLSSLVMRKSTEAMLGGAENVTVGTYIFVAVSQDAARSRVPTVPEAQLEQFMSMLMRGNSAMLESISTMMFYAADMGTEVVKFVGTGEVPEYLHFPEMQRLAAEASRTKRPVQTLVYEELLSGRGSPFARALGFGGMPYLNTYYTSQLLHVERIHSIIGIIVCVAMLVFLFIAAWNMVRQLFEMMLLYIISPYFVASIPLDEGELFHKWRDMFISRLVMGFGIVISMNIFLLMIPVIFSRQVMFTVFVPLDFAIRIMLMIAAAASVVKANGIVQEAFDKGSSIMSGSSTEDEGRRMAFMLPNMVKQKGKQLVTEQVEKVADKGVKFAGKKAGQGFTGMTKAVSNKLTKKKAAPTGKKGGNDSKDKKSGGKSDGGKNDGDKNKSDGKKDKLNG